MKKLLLLFLYFACFGLIPVWAQQQPGLSYNSARFVCDVNQDWILDTSPTAVAPTGSGENYGCLTGSSLQRPHWFRVYVATGGNINLRVLPVLNTNLDHAVWGPFQDPNPSSIAGLGAPINCSNSPINVDDIELINQPAGGYYIIMVTNQQGLNGPNNTFRFVPNHGNTAVFGTELTLITPSFQSVRSCEASFPILVAPIGQVSNLTYSGVGVSSNGIFAPSAAGVGTHIITVSGRPYGCSATLSVQCTVQVVSSPSTVSIGALPTNGISYLNPSVTLQAVADPPGDYLYSWTTPPGVTPPGNVPIFNIQVPGLYTVVTTPDPLSLPACTGNTSSRFIYGAPVIVHNGPDTICWNRNPSVSQTVPPVLPTGVSVSGYQWQSKASGSAVFTDMPGAVNQSDIGFITVSGNLEIRLKATLSNGDLLFSNLVDFVVLPPLERSRVTLSGSSSADVCFNGAVTLEFTPTTGGGGRFIYDWERNTGSGWMLMAPRTTLLQRTFSNLTQSAWYRVKATDTSAFGCGSVVSDSINILVQSPVTAGSISVNSDTVCIMNAVTVGSTSPGTGSGTLQYSWQSSTDQITWTDIPGQQGLTLSIASRNTPGRVFYRRNVRSQSAGGVLCPAEGPISSNEVSVIWVDDYPFLSARPMTNLDGPFAHPWSSGSVNNQSANGFSLTATAATNSAGSAEYRLAQGIVPVDGIVSFTYARSTSNNANTPNIQSLLHNFLVGASASGAVNLSSNGVYHIKVNQGDEIAFRISLFNDGNTGPNASATGVVSNFRFHANGANDTGVICPGSSFTISDPVLATSNVAASWRWAILSGNGTLTGTLTGSGVVSSNPVYNSVLADANTEVRILFEATRTGGACDGRKDSAFVVINVRPELLVPIVVGGQDRTRCYSSAAGVMIATPATGGSGPYAYQWQFREANGSWTDIAGSNALVLNDNRLLLANTEYRILVTDLGVPSCGSNIVGVGSVNVNVLPSLSAPVFNPNIAEYLYRCPNTTLTLNVDPATGGHNVFDYTWQFIDSVDVPAGAGANDPAINTWAWQSVPGAIGIPPTAGLTYTIPNLPSGTTRYYRVVARDATNDTPEDPNCGSAWSSAVKVSYLDVVAPDIRPVSQIVVYLDENGEASFDCSNAATLDSASSDNCGGAVTNFELKSCAVDYRVTPISYAPESFTGSNGPAGDDNVSSLVPIGFDFNYFGNTYSGLYISTNGFITFNSGSSSGCCSGQNIPDPNSPNNLIALAWTDLDAGVGSISYTTLGVEPNRRFVVNYSVVRFSSGGNPVQVQAILFEESNEIEIHTSLISAGFINTTQGIENANGTSAFIVPGRNSSQWSATNDAFRFSPFDGCPVFSCPAGNTTVCLYGSDVSGNVGSASINVVKIDTIRPITRAVDTLTVYLDASGQAFVANASVANNGSTDNCGPLSFSISPNNYSCSDLFGRSAVLTSIDPSGNSSTASLYVKVLDIINPVSIPRRQVIGLLDTFGVVSNITAASVDSASFDNCTIVERVVLNDALNLYNNDYSCADLNNIRLAYLVVVDESGNRDTTEFEILVRDSFPPAVLTFPTAPIYLRPNDDCQVLFYWANGLTYADNCGGSVVLTDPVMYHGGSVVADSLVNTPVVLLSVGTHFFDFSLTDVRGNSRRFRQVVEVIDTIRPWLNNCPSSVNLITNSWECGARYFWVEPTASDNCGGVTVTSSHAPGSLFLVGLTTVTYTVTDAVGLTRSCSFTVSVLDNTPPTVSPRNQNAYLNAQGQVVLNGCDLVDASDNCNPNLICTPSTITLTCANRGFNTRAITVSDGSNQTTVNVTISVFDTIRPVLNTKQNIVVDLNASGTGTLTVAGVDSNSTDNCGVVARRLSQTQFNCSDVGVRQITFTVEDASGNDRSEVVSVLVRDAVAPVVNTVYSTAANAFLAYLSGNGDVTIPAASLISYSDNCGVDSIVPSTFTFNCSNVNLPGQSNIRSVRVRDINGLSTTINVHVSVRDTVRPVAGPVGRTLILSSAGTATISASSLVNVSDNCCVGAITSGTPAQVNVNLGCANVGTNVIQVTVNDCNGNSVIVPVQVVVVDTTAPVLTITNPTPRVVFLDAQCSASLSSTQLVGSNDACGAVVLTPANHFFNGANCNDTVRVTITARDVNQNTSSIVVPVIVRDTITPVANFVPQNVNVGECEAVVVYDNPTGSDNCGSVVVTQTSGLATGSTFPVGVTTNTFTLTDVCGNSRTVSFTVTVNDFINPYVPSNYTVCSLDSSIVLSTLTGVTFSGTGVDGNRFYPTRASVGTNVVSWTFTDAFGCDTSGLLTVEVLASPDQPEILRLSSTLLRVSQSFSSYQWFRYGGAIPGASAREYNVTQSGVYSVQVMGSSGCFRMSNPIGMGVGVGIEELNAEEINLYPNPNAGSFTLSIADFDGKDRTIEILDMAGRTMYQGSMAEGIQDFNLPYLAQGRYIVRILGNRGLSIKSLVVKY